MLQRCTVFFIALATDTDACALAVLVVKAISHCPKSLSQSKAKRKAIDMKIVLILFSYKWNSFSQERFCT